MYYLAQFCRICIKTNVDLIDVESDDEDSIKLKEKLEECTEIVISKERFPTKICSECVEKLKVSYDFHEMCKKSSRILSELVSDSDKVTTEKFSNSELRVTLSPLKLHQEGLQVRGAPKNGSSILKSLLSGKNTSRKDTDVSQRGGLRNIIAFTRSFDFGYVETNESSISKLVQFSEGFFKRDFSAFQRTVLYIIENNDNLDDEDSMFNTIPEEIKEIQFEEVVIEPDIRIKTESMENEEVIENPRVKEEEIVENFCIEQDFSRNRHTCTTIPLVENLDYLKKLYCHRSFSQNSVRCRTRGNPYINPHLKKQFMLRSFQCKNCPRYFKTPGYLKAHCAKVHNGLN